MYKGMLIIYQCYVDGNYTGILVCYWNIGSVTMVTDVLLITQNIDSDKSTVRVLIVPRPTAYCAFHYLTNQKTSNSFVIV